MFTAFQNVGRPQQGVSESPAVLAGRHTETFSSTQLAMVDIYEIVTYIYKGSYVLEILKYLWN